MIAIAAFAGLLRFLKLADKRQRRINFQALRFAGLGKFWAHRFAL